MPKERSKNNSMQISISRIEQAMPLLKGGCVPYLKTEDGLKSIYSQIENKKSIRRYSRELNSTLGSRYHFIRDSFGDAKESLEEPLYMKQLTESLSEKSIKEISETEVQEIFEENAKILIEKLSQPYEKLLMDWDRSLVEDIEKLREKDPKKYMSKKNYRRDLEMFEKRYDIGVGSEYFSEKKSYEDLGREFDLSHSWSRVCVIREIPEMGEQLIELKNSLIRNIIDTEMGN